MYLLNPAAKYGNTSIEEAIQQLNKPDDKAKGKQEPTSDEVTEFLLFYSLHRLWKISPSPH